MTTSNKQKNPWGGSWTEQKLETFISYVRAYLTIMNKNRDKFGWKLLYFDGFAGCGSRTPDEDREEIEKTIDLFGSENIEANEIQVYNGAAERVVKLEQQMRGFDFYYFIDFFEANCTKLELKLAQYKTSGYKVFRPGDANQQALQLAAALKRDNKLKSLCFLDPFGMTINWSTIVSLAGKNIDLWILIPSGVIINRLLQKDGTLLYPDKLINFFDLDEATLKQHFYETYMEQTLFGEKEVINKKSNSIRRIAELYIERLGTLFPFVTDKPLVMRNHNNVPIYHFVCASFNETAVKIAQDIIDKKQK